jgi:hypothetical protein
MRKVAFLTLASSMFGTLALVAVAWVGAKDNEPTIPEAESPGLLSRLFPDDNMGPSWRLKAKKQRYRLEEDSAKKPVRAKSDSKKDDSNKPAEAALQEPSKHEKEIAEMKREQAAYLRRLAVCDQLRDVALKNNDENLRRQAEELEAQASAIYFKQTSHLSAAKAEKAIGEEEKP